jgi:predicted PurR-regulated permease PerM
MFTAALNSVGGILGNSLLVLVYIFLFLYFRDRLKNFILKIADARGKNEARQTMEQSRKVAQKYLSGLAMMIVCLWILYGIGFSIVGVKNALFFAILCGLLEIVPFVGNITGTLLTCLMVMAQGGSPGMLIGVLCIYGFVQTFQSYVLEPLVVGSNVNINPLFTILIIVFGEFIWGIPGMILAIPLLGIVKIVCDHVPELEPVGYLMGQDKKEGSNKWVEKLKGLFSKK